MPVISRVEVADELLRELEETAAARGITVAEVASARIEASLRRDAEARELDAKADALRDLLSLTP